MTGRSKNSGSRRKMKVGDLVRWSPRAKYLNVLIGEIVGIVLYAFPACGNVEVLDSTGVRVEIQCDFLEVVSEGR